MLSQEPAPRPGPDFSWIAHESGAAEAKDGGGEAYVTPCPSRCPSGVELSELALGQLDPDRARSLREHVGSCRRCEPRFRSNRDSADESLERELRDALRNIDGELERSRADPGLSAGDSPQRSLGRYRVLRRLGSGGMGIVYEARQRRPDRRVALKVLHPTAASPSGLRRFELEGEALSRLAHPAIAHVYEVGRFSSAYGVLPFLAMELVRGRTPLEHAREHDLDVRGRVELMLGICAGIEHAHQRGVLHRDIKPSNILVDAGGQPKVLDFGLARLMDEGGGGDATRTGQILGTLAYMSPEQLSGGSEAVDVRSDLYAIGTLLVELITERPPHDLSGLHFAEAVARLARSPAPALDTRLPGVDVDLAAVAARALEPDPDHRYPTVRALSDDLRHWLAGEPIQARAWGWSTRLVRAMRRHRRATAGAALALLLITFGVGGTVSQHMRARRAELESLAEARAGAATGRFLDELVSSGDPFFSAASPDRSVRDLLDEASARLAAGSASNLDLPPRTRRMLLGTLGRAYMHVAEYELAAEHLGRRRVLLEEALGSEHPETVDAALDLVSLALNQQDQRGALRSLERLAPLLGPRHASRAAELSGRAHYALARFRLAAEDFAHALALLAPDDEERAARTSILERLLAQALERRGFPERSAELLEQALALSTDSLGADHPSTALTRYQLARTLSGLGRLAEADGHFERALACLDRVLGAGNPQSPHVAADWGDLRASLGDREAAIRLYHRALADLSLNDPAVNARHRAPLCVRLATLLEQTGEAEDLLAEAAALMGLELESEPGRDVDALAFDLRHPLVLLAKALARAGHFVEVEQLYLRVLGEARERGADGEATLTLHSNLAAAIAQQGRLEEAEQLYRSTLATRRELLGGDHVRTAAAESNLAWVLLRAGRHAESVPLLEHAVRVTAREVGPDHARTARMRRHLAEALLGSGELARARREIDAALALVLDTCNTPRAPQVGDTWLVHGECRLAQGHFADARSSLTIAREILEEQPVRDDFLLTRAAGALARCEKGVEHSAR